MVFALSLSGKHALDDDDGCCWSVANAKADRDAKLTARPDNRNGVRRLGGVAFMATHSVLCFICPAGRVSAPATTSPAVGEVKSTCPKARFASSRMSPAFKNREWRVWRGLIVLRGHSA